VPKLRRQSGSDVAAALRTVGFEIVSTKGSHAKLQRKVANTKQTLTIPMHDELAIGTLQAIYRQALQYVDEGTLKPLFYIE
jgi:predicted RNA binding protein YcfA (HicA-like mRNA interferase family)